MSDNKQVKALGLRFARALQMTLKTAVMFTVEHKSVERPIQQSFLLLNNLLKESGQFTFGKGESILTLLKVRHPLRQPSTLLRENGCRRRITILSTETVRRRAIVPFLAETDSARQRRMAGRLRLLGTCYILPASNCRSTS